MLVIVSMLVVIASDRRLRLALRLPDTARTAFYDFVEFTPIQPNASALGAIINLDALALRH
jgi:hypothetical protein